MKKLLITAFLLSLAAPAHAQQDVNGYVRSDGRFVMPYTRRVPQPLQFNFAPLPPPPPVPNQNVDIVPNQPVQMMVPGIGLPTPHATFVPFGQQ